MKSFLNRFRRKEDEEQPPTAPPASADNATGPSGEKPLRRTGISVAPRPKPAPGEPTGNGNAGIDAESSATPPEDDDLVLELGDFLHRIPAQLLRPGTPDVHTELRFPLVEVSERIARNETAIPLSELYAKIPHIFTQEIQESDPLEIRFPWQKVLKLIKETAPGTIPTSGLSIAAAESLAYKLKTRHTTRNIVMGRGAGGLNVPESPLGKAGSKLAQRPVTWFSRPSGPQGSSGEYAAAALPAAAVQPELVTTPEPPAEDAQEFSSPAVQDTTALIETLREEFQRELQQQLQARDEALAKVREEYERRIVELQDELTKLRNEQRDEPKPASTAAEETGETPPEPSPQ